VTGPEIDVSTIVSDLFEENAYVVRKKGSDVCVVIDPGLDPVQIVKYIESENLSVAASLITHGHSDHIGGNATLKERWPDCQIVIGTQDAPKLINPELNLSASFGVELSSPPADVTVDDGDVYSAAGLEFTVAAIPGHSVGHVVYCIHATSPKMVFVGDVIFYSSVGRTDLPGGSFQQLAAGIHKKLFSMPDETILLPGHGPKTTVGREKISNPFVGQKARKL